MAGYAEHDASVANDAEAGRERARPGVDPGMLPPQREGNFEIHVKFKNGMWWAMPRHLSEPLLEFWRNGDNQCSYVWADTARVVGMRKVSRRPRGAKRRNAAADRTHQPTNTCTTSARNVHTLYVTHRTQHAKTLFFIFW